MKKLLLFASVALLLSSCKKTKVDVDFGLEVSDIYFTVDTTSLTGNVELAATTFSSNLQAELESHDANLDDVESIEVTNVEFLHLNPQNFDIVNNAHAYISVPGQAEQRIAYKDPIADGLTFITMDVEPGVNVKNYLAAPTVTFRVTGQLSDPNIAADSIQCHLSFRVHATVEAN